MRPGKNNENQLILPSHPLRPKSARVIRNINADDQKVHFLLNLHGIRSHNISLIIILSRYNKYPWSFELRLA